jgi:glycosyltransferase involved in cell wall biosynthesis
VETNRTATKLTIVMPAHNEEASIAEVLGGVLAAQIDAATEILVVNDGSTDQTAAILAGITDPRLRVITHEVNRGKGAAVPTYSSSMPTTSTTPTTSGG